MLFSTTSKVPNGTKREQTEGVQKGSDIVQIVQTAKETSRYQAIKTQTTLL